jgi:hypothetical protein
MLEPMRSRYLAALGVDMYVPQLILPGAKLSTACEWDVAALEAPVVAPPGIESIKTEVEPQVPMAQARVPVVESEKKPTRPATAEPTSATPTAAVVVPKFALSIVRAANGVLLIDDAPVAAARSEYERLLGNFLNAMLKDGQCSLDIFFWPMHKSAQIVQDENAARETLAAHLHKQIQQRALHTVLLLGDAAQRWVDLDAALGVDGQALRCIRSTSLLACLREPALKRQLWNDVRELSVG